MVESSGQVTSAVGPIATALAGLRRDLHRSTRGRAGSAPPLSFVTQWLVLRLTAAHPTNHRHVVSRRAECRGHLRPSRYGTRPRLATDPPTGTCLQHPATVTHPPPRGELAPPTAPTRPPRRQGACGCGHTTDAQRGRVVQPLATGPLTQPRERLRRAQRGSAATEVGRRCRDRPPPPSHETTRCVTARHGANGAV